MSLSCGCENDGGYERWWVYPQDFAPFMGKCRARCRSCRELIEIGVNHVAVERYRLPETEIEERIYGGEILLALVAYGYCVDIDEDMRGQLREHWEYTGYVPPDAALGLASTEAQA